VWEEPCRGMGKATDSLNIKQLLPGSRITIDNRISEELYVRM
jgi:hypothetical protein